MKSLINIVKKTIFAIGLLSTLSQPSLAASIFRLKPSAPKDLLQGIYNNVLIGNDRLSDIENYMSSSLKADYKRAVKITKKGGTCDLPRILSNDIFSHKLKGFSVEPIEESTWSARTRVILDTGSKYLPSTSILSKFDPKIYEVINFDLTKRFLDWKIDDIKVSVPDVDHAPQGFNYKSIDLREALRSCK